MMQGPHHLGAVFLTAVLLANDALPEPGAATASSETRAASEARVRYERGAREYSAGRYVDAIELFKDADRLEPSPALSFNMARAYQKIGDDASALRSYREYLRRATRPDDESEVRRVIDTLSRRLADRGVQQVTVLSVPPGSTVILDGQPVGVTPWTSEIVPGGHSLALHLDGREDVVRRFELPRYEAIDVQVTLPALSPVVAAPPPTAPHLAAPRSAPRQPSPAAQADSPHPGRPFQTVGIVSLAAGGVALGGAFAFELMRRASEQRAEGDHEQLALAHDLDTLQTQRSTARILTGVGAGFVTLGAVLLLVSPAEPPVQDRSARFKLDVTTSGLGAAVLGRF